jgi:DNA repair exonuclease SbcCD ATPase subunit
LGLGKYFKSAFLYRWNVLAFLGGLGFALVSGYPDVVLPLVLAAELGYVGLLGTHPKYQRYVDAQEAVKHRTADSEKAVQALRHILASPPRLSMARFEKLRSRCMELRQIASDLKQPGAIGDGAPLEALQLAGLDRLLWIFMRLLFTQHSIARFLEQTSMEKIQAEVAEVEKRIARLKPDDPSPHIQKVRRTLEDNLQTCRDRLVNYEKAQANHELVGLEIDRLENKIKSLAELAVNRQEPEFISSQVDQVATSMVETEKTMNELEFATGLSHLEESVPELLRPPVQVTAE